MIRSGPYPQLAGLDVDLDLTTLFEFGLTLLLDGLAGLIGPPGRA